MNMKFEDIGIGESFMWRNGLYTKTYGWIAIDEGNGNSVALNSQAKVRKVKKMNSVPYWKVLLYNWYTVVSYYLRMKV